MTSIYKVIILYILAFSHSNLLHASTNPDKGSYLILNAAEVGFGATLSSVLSALDIYDQGGYAGIKIDLNSGFYIDPNYGPNWWEYFFEPIEIGDKDAPQYVFDEYEINDMINRGFPMSRDRAKELIDRYIHLKPEIEKEIGTILANNFNGHFVVGMHYRGTDKKLETPHIPYTTYLYHAKWWMKEISKKEKPLIFIATDDENFLKYMCSIYGKKVIYNEYVRSTDESPLHYGKDRYKSNYQKGKEALIDCILLSKCNVLLYPAASAFSMLSLKFNPSLPGVPLSAEK